jgi:hypothetical protein
MIRCALTAQSDAIRTLPALPRVRSALSTLTRTPEDARRTFFISSLVTCKSSDNNVNRFYSCKPCDQGTWAPVGSDRCYPVVACTIENYYPTWSSCRNGKRTKHYLAKQPKTCVGAFAPPADTTEDCYCAPGTRLDSTGACVACATGYVSTGEAVSNYHRMSFNKYIVLCSAKHGIQQINDARMFLPDRLSPFKQPLLELLFKFPVPMHPHCIPNLPLAVLVSVIVHGFTRALAEDLILVNNSAQLALTSRWKPLCVLLYLFSSCRIGCLRSCPRLPTSVPESFPTSTVSPALVTYKFS